jgi:hypothetical protein
MKKIIGIDFDGTCVTDLYPYVGDNIGAASGVLTVMMHGDREDNPIPEMLPNAGTNPDNIITTISGIGNDGGDW